MGELDSQRKQGDERGLQVAMRIKKYFWASLRNECKEGRNIRVSARAYGMVAAWYPFVVFLLFKLSQVHSLIDYLGLNSDRSFIAYASFSSTGFSHYRRSLFSGKELISFLSFITFLYNEINNYFS